MIIKPIFAIVIVMIPSINITNTNFILINFKIYTSEQVAEFAPFTVNETGKLASKINAAWAWPVTVFLTWGCGFLTWGYDLLMGKNTITRGHSSLPRS